MPDVIAQAIESGAIVGIVVTGLVAIVAIIYLASQRPRSGGG